MRYVIAILAVAGIVVSSLALHAHYSYDLQPCDINAHWDCGVVNHSRYAMIHGLPVAIIGIGGYAAISLLALFGRRWLTALLVLAALAFSLRLTNIEAHVLEVWCLYCVCSQVIIGILTVLSVAWLVSSRRRAVA